MPGQFRRSRDSLRFFNERPEKVLRFTLHESCLRERLGMMKSPIGRQEDPGYSTELGKMFPECGNLAKECGCHKEKLGLHFAGTLVEDEKAAVPQQLLHGEHAGTAITR